MARRKVKPTQKTRGPGRQGSIPAGRQRQASRKRPAKKLQGVGRVPRAKASGARHARQRRRVKRSPSTA